MKVVHTNNGAAEAIKTAILSCLQKASNSLNTITGFGSDRINVMVRLYWW